MLDNLEHALATAERDLTVARERIHKLESEYGQAAPERRPAMVLELAKYLEFRLDYEYFCYNDENHDSSAYLSVAGDEDFAYWTMAGVPREFKKNPIPQLAKEAMVRITKMSTT